MPDNAHATPLIIYTDGGSRHNPGPSAFGYAIYDPAGRLLEQRGEYIGQATNNVAEYRAMIAAAGRAAALQAPSVEFRVDSLLLKQQVAGKYRVKATHLRPLLAELMAHLQRIPQWAVNYVPREANLVADQLVNDAIDSQGVVT